VIAILALALLAAFAPAVSATDVHGDDEADRYIGTGGLILPPTVASSTRIEVASCPGCQWRMTSPCVESDSGNPFSGTSTCLSVVRGCAAMAELLRAWFRPAGEPWREIGLLCIRDGPPVTVEDVGSRVAERLASELPAVRPSFQPATGVVTQLPVIFDSGQSAAGLSTSVDILGQSVGIQARPEWEWEFGDGSRQVTSDPGGRFPHGAVAHVYRFSRTYVVRMVTSWSAQFTVEGLGPFPVTEPVTQSARMTVSVGEGRAVLATR